MQRNGRKDFVNKCPVFGVPYQATIAVLSLGHTDFQFFVDFDNVIQEYAYFPSSERCRRSPSLLS